MQMQYGIIRSYNIIVFYEHFSWKCSSSHLWVFCFGDPVVYGGNLLCRRRLMKITPPNSLDEIPKQLGIHRETLSTWGNHSQFWFSISTLALFNWLQKIYSLFHGLFKNEFHEFYHFAFQIQKSYAFIKDFFC